MSRLMYLRLEHGFETQQQLADACDLKMQTISRIERGATVMPQSKTLGRLAKAFGMDPRELSEKLRSPDEVA